MRLCATMVFLMALTWARADPVPSAPSSDQSDQFDRIKDITVILGRLNFLVGFANSTFSRSVLGAIPSVWANLTKTETGIEVTEFKKSNETCTKIVFNITTHGDTNKAQMFGMTTDIQILNFSETAFVMDLKGYVSSVKSLSKDLHLDSKHYDDHDHGQHDDIDLNVHQLFLLGRETVVSEHDLKVFREYAKSKEFTGEADFLYKSEHEYCTEEESVPL